ncbi:MAG: class I SAM-dependent methyltransferase [Phycisphaeraceae bacterium]|nr:class I SAM-dependent methyltransferase [Phycisphaeraceae bacterium]
MGREADPLPEVRLPARVRRFEQSYNRRTGAYVPGSGRSDYGSVEVEVGRLWHALVMLLRPRTVLETGTYFGYSTCCIAAALRDLGGPRRIITIDPQAREHLWRGSDLEPLIEWMPMRSQEAAPRLAGTEFDLLVLDSDHHYQTVMEELVVFEPMLRPGGAILLHDSLYFDGVGQAVRAMESNPRFECVTLDSPRTHGRPRCRRPGVTLVRKARKGRPSLRLDPEKLDLHVGDVQTRPLLRRRTRGTRA